MTDEERVPLSTATNLVLDAIGAQPDDTIERIEVLARRWRLDTDGDPRVWLRRLGDGAAAIQEIKRARAAKRER